uniref:Uncharacterized protein n=1 Tax=Vitis vinifera TaxID=29760 RepID=A5B670_VITVI|nr:hypothetical protein VITISV_039018 [Vitis vinifera]
MHPHIYLILPPRVDTIRGEQLPHLWPLLRFQLGVLLQRRPRLQSQESPPKQLEIHSLSLLPPDALSLPAHPLRATPIAERAFHDEAYFDHYVLRQQPELGDSYRLLERQIADAFHIPYAPADPAAFRRWAPLSEWDMTLILRPATIVERASLLTNGIRYCTINIPQNFLSQGKFLHSPYHLYLLRPLQLPRSPYQRQHRLMPHLLFLLPQSRPLLSLVQSIRMDHFQLRQNQQTLILREIQQHLGLLPPAPPVSPVPSKPFASADDFDPNDDATPIAVPSTVAAEDPSYPPEEPTT